MHILCNQFSPFAFYKGKPFCSFVVTQQAFRVIKSTLFAPLLFWQRVYFLQSPNMERSSLGTRVGSCKVGFC